MIVTRSLTKKYGRLKAVDNVDFTAPQGAVVGFLGPNGAGKTTTLRMICGMLAPTEGSVSVDGLDVQQNPLEIRQRIGYLPESAPLYTEMRVAEFLKFRAKLFGIPRSERRDAVELALRRCWLEQVQRRPINQLSKGYRQRVGLAAALLHNPPVLILDEPTVGLDPSQIREVRSLIRELAGEHTVLLSTHILPEVELTCDRFVMIAGGRIRDEGSIDELHQRGRDSARYLIETRDDEAVAKLRALSGVETINESRLGGGWRRVVITADSGREDLRPEIATVLQRMGAPLRELHRETTSLEQVFMDVVSQAQVSEIRATASEPSATPVDPADQKEELEEENGVDSMDDLMRMQRTEKK